MSDTSDAIEVCLEIAGDLLLVLFFDSLLSLLEGTVYGLEATFI